MSRFGVLSLAWLLMLGACTDTQSGVGGTTVQSLDTQASTTPQTSVVAGPDFSEATATSSGVEQLPVDVVERPELVFLVVDNDVHRYSISNNEQLTQEWSIAVAATNVTYRRSQDLAVSLCCEPASGVFRTFAPAAQEPSQEMLGQLTDASLAAEVAVFNGGFVQVLSDKVTEPISFPVDVRPYDAAISPDGTSVMVAALDAATESHSLYWFPSQETRVGFTYLVSSAEDEFIGLIVDADGLARFINRSEPAREVRRSESGEEIGLDLEQAVLDRSADRHGRFAVTLFEDGRLVSSDLRSGESQDLGVFPSATRTDW